MSNAVKDLNVSSSSPIGFEVEWHNSQFDKTKFLTTSEGNEFFPFYVNLWMVFIEVESEFYLPIKSISLRPFP